MEHHNTPSNNRSTSMIGKRHEYEAMANTETNLWWYQALHTLSYQSIKSKFGSNKNIAILDAGCGTGGMLNFLKSKGYNNIKGIDLSEDAIGFCKMRGFDVVHSNLLNLTQHFESQSFDAIICNDLLCYLRFDEQKEVALQINTLLKDQGIWVCNVPALDVFKGEHDIAVGLLQRFTFENITNVTKNLYTIEQNRFWPFLLSPLIYLTRRSQAKSMKNKTAETSVESDVKMPNFALNFIFKFLTLFEFFLPNPIKFGSSLFFIASKNKNNT
jgi:SAM-dependent methyltransferase